MLVNLGLNNLIDEQITVKSILRSDFDFIEGVNYPQIINKVSYFLFKRVKLSYKFTINTHSSTLKTLADSQIQLKYKFKPVSVYIRTSFKASG